MKVKIDGTEHDLLDAEQLDNHEIMAIEKETLTPVSEWQRMSMGVITGLVWATLRRENPQLRYRDVKFRMADVIPDDEEVEEAEAEEKGKDGGAAS